MVRGVSQRIVRAVGRGVLGDVADAQDELEPGEKGEKPEGEAPPPLPGDGRADDAEQHDDQKHGREGFCEGAPVGRVGEVARTRDAARGVDRFLVAGELEGAHDASDEQLHAGLAGEVAEELAQKARARGGEGQGERQVRVEVRLRVPVVHEVVAAIGAHVRQDRRAAEPATGELVQPAAAEQRVVRSLVHEDREPELPRSDDRDGKEEGERVRPPGEERDGECDRAPGVCATSAKPIASERCERRRSVSLSTSAAIARS